MVEIHPSASSFRGCEVVDSVVVATESPWLSQVGHSKLMHVLSTGSQEIGRSNGLTLHGLNPGREKSRPTFFQYWKLNLIGLIGLTLSTCSPICITLPRLGGAGGGDFTYRIPPAWSPENEQHCSFRAWCQDLQLWLMLTDLQ
ncbi:MAG: hypothetical protein ACKPKO_45780, partial [Candidatus Fonsibacter sp.]